MKEGRKREGVHNEEDERSIGASDEVEDSNMVEDAKDVHLLFIILEY